MADNTKLDQDGGDEAQNSNPQKRNSFSFSPESETGVDFANGLDSATLQIASEAAKASHDVTPAHVQIDRECVAFYYPEHLPREKDPHYKLFNKARARLIKAGVGCWICGTKENLECHHSECEYAAATGVDVKKFAALFPEYHIEDEEEFLCYVESEGNFQILCAIHHRSPFAGIHHCVYPNWKLQRFWRDDLPAPVQAATPAHGPNITLPTGEKP